MNRNFHCTFKLFAGQRASLLTGAALAIALAVPAGAADFYAGKRMKLTVGSSPGGGYDTYTRLLGRTMERLIPGKPSIKVINMQGGGGLRSVLYTYKVAAKDGTEFANIRASNMLDSILGIRGTEFKPLSFTWIGSMASDADVCVFWHTSGIRTFDDLIKKKPTLGSTGKGAQAFMFPNAINNVLGTKMKIILGYKGTRTRMLAVEQGELSGMCGLNGSTLISRLTKFYESKQLIPVIQSGLKPHPALKHVPLTQSFAKTKEQKDILNALFSQMAIARPYAAPPGIPAEATKILRAAFRKSMKDAKFLKDAKRLKLEISPTYAKGTRQIIANLTALPDDIKKKVRKAIGK
jgi:tripartite-type tricarboxylate transporter receptor subunit TctC